jgi:hypothetical protein
MRWGKRIFPLSRGGVGKHLFSWIHQKVLFPGKIRFLKVRLSHNCDSILPINVTLDSQEYDLDLKLIYLVQKRNIRPSVVM